MAKPNKHKSVSPKTVDLDALTQGSDSIAYHAPLQCATTPIYEHSELSTGLQDGAGRGIESLKGQAGQEVEAGRETGGRSESFTPPAKVTAKPLSPIPDNPSGPKSGLSGTKANPLLKKPKSNPQSDMPVLGDLNGVGEEKGEGVVHSYRQVPFTPEIDPPSDTQEILVSSPFVTNNVRIDRRTAFTQYCRLGEGRTYMKVASIMALPESTIKEWAKEDGWENAYRERITADIVQVAKEENIHEALDMKREMIALLRTKLNEAKAGKEVFKNPKEMLDTLQRVEELTGSANLDGKTRPGQIYVIIDREEYEARVKINESARKEEAKA